MPEPSFEVLADSLKDRDTWLRLRAELLGASEVASVFGLSPFTSAFALWAHKTQGVSENLDDKEYVWWGAHLEHAIITGFAERSGRQIVPFGLLVRSRAYPWLGATPDALTTDDAAAGARAHVLTRCVGAMRRLLRHGRSVPPALVVELEEAMRGWWPLQVKNIGHRSAEHWVEGAPDYYRLQCQDEALVMGAAKCTAAALIGGQRLAWEDVERDDLTDRRLVNLTRRFWTEHVVARVPPEVDGDASTTRALEQMHPLSDPEKRLLLPASFQPVADERDVLKAEIKEREERLALLDNRLKLAMGDAEEAWLPDGTGFTYKTVHQPARTVSYEARSYRTLLRKGVQAPTRKRQRKNHVQREDSRERPDREAGGPRRPNQ